jgi:hypothetical protein
MVHHDLVSFVKKSLFLLKLARLDFEFAEPSFFVSADDVMTLFRWISVRS